MSQYYVYIWFRPWDGSPCYVGKGKGNRAFKFRRPDNLYLQHIIAKAGGKLPALVIREGLTEQEASETEEAFIAAIGRYPNGPLANATDGGDGVIGYTYTVEAKGKIRLKALGRTISESTRAKLSTALKGRKKPAGHGAAVSAALLGHKHSVETRAKIGAALRGKKLPPRKPLTEAQKENLRQKNLGRKASPATRLKMSLSHLARNAGASA